MKHTWAREGVEPKRVTLGVTLVIAVLVTGTAIAGSGWVDKENGEIHLISKFFYPPPQDELDRFIDIMKETSEYLCDVTEGQVRLGSVTIQGGCEEGDCQIGADQADLWIWPTITGANSSACVDTFACNSIGKSGNRILLSRKYIQPELEFYAPTVIMHEMTHYVFNVGDEYEAGCGNIPKDRCIECSDLGDPGTGTTVTQAGECGTGEDYSEWCTQANHDLERGQGENCADYDDVFPPCDDDGSCDYDSVYWNQNICGAYDPAECRWEKSHHSFLSTYQFGENLSSWDHAARIWDEAIEPLNQFPLTVPQGLPQATNNTTFCNTDPDIILEFDAPDRVVLVLDRSWSMAFPPSEFEKCGPGGCPEICGNNKDDDNNAGTPDDPPGCAQPRMESLRKTATHYLQLLRETPQSAVEAGIVSFNCDTQTKVSPQLVTEDAYDDIFEPKVLALQPNLGTAIADALVAGAAEIGDDVQTGALLLVTDGFSNCDENDLDTVLGQLEDDGIKVYVISFGPAVGSVEAMAAATETGGEFVSIGTSRELSPAFVQQWAHLMNAMQVIPQLPYRVGQVGPPPGGDNGDATKWAAGDDDPPGDPQTSPPGSNVFEVLVSPGTERLIVSLGGDLPDMDLFGVAAELQGPPGPHPSLFNSEAVIPDPWMHVHDDKHYKWIELFQPNPGLWLIEVTGLQGPEYAFEQTGYISVVTENDEAFLFTDLDRTVVSDPAAEPVRVFIRPSFAGPVSGADVTATLVLPDGSTLPLSVDDFTESSGGYLAKVWETQMPYKGMYEVRVRVATDPAVASSSQGGDPGTGFDPDVPVPSYEQTSSEFFVVTVGAKVCVSGDPDDCDGDGLTGESPVDDMDGDGIPDECDADSDGDEIDDAFEIVGPIFDTDGDGALDPYDTDADNDGVHDSEDPDVSVLPTSPDYLLSLGDAKVDKCGSVHELPIFLSNQQPVAAVNAAVNLLPTGPVQVLSVSVGPDVPAAAVQSFTWSIGPPTLPAGKTLAQLVLAQGSELPPGNFQHVLTLTVQAGATATVGDAVSGCFEPGSAGPTDDTTWIGEWNATGGLTRHFASMFCGDLDVVGDTEPPSTQCPSHAILTADASCAAPWSAEAPATDNCDPAPAVASTPSLPTVLVGPGEHVVTYESTDASSNSESCVTLVTLEDLDGPLGGITAPAPGICNGGPVTLQTNWTDNCAPSVAETYTPPGPTYTSHGDYDVGVVATDDAGNSTAAQIAFTIDLVAPTVSQGPVDTFAVPSTQPFTDLFVSGDADGASGAIVETASLDTCLLFDGETFGDADGALSDELLTFDVAAACSAIVGCQLDGLATPLVDVETRDCAGNSTASAWSISLVPPVVPSDCQSQLTLDTPQHGVTRLSWMAPFPADSHDVIRGDLDNLRGGAPARPGDPQGLGPVVCLANDDSSGTIDDSGAAPPAGSAWFYLVRSSLSGNASSYGSGTSDSTREAVTGDCPN